MAALLPPQSKDLRSSSPRPHPSTPPANPITPQFPQLTPASVPTSIKPSMELRSSTTPSTASLPPQPSGGSPSQKTKNKFNTSPPSTSVAKATSFFPSPSKSPSATARISASVGTASIVGPNSLTPAMPKSSPPRS